MSQQTVSQAITTTTLAGVAETVTFKERLGSKDNEQLFSATAPAFLDEAAISGILTARFGSSPGKGATRNSLSVSFLSPESATSPVKKSWTATLTVSLPGTTRDAEIIKEEVLLLTRWLLANNSVVLASLASGAEL